MEKIIFEQLAQVKFFVGENENYYSLKQTFSFLNNDKSVFGDRNKYRIKVSRGQTNESKMWWCGIFDKDFYYEYFHAKNDGNIGASKGYYIVYLFNEDKTRVYLSINQAAKDICKKKNREQLNNVQKINYFLRDQLSKDNIFLRDITGLLTESDPLGKDYEAGNILAIEYDLTNERISNEKFYEDLLKIQGEFIKIVKIFEKSNGYITNKKDKISYDLIERCVIDYLINNKYEDDSKEFIEDSYNSKDIDTDEAEKIGNRKVQYESANGSKRVKTSAKLRKYVMEKNKYLCLVDTEHKTFFKKTDVQYVEAHHLVPLEYQKEFGDYFNLDRLENLVTICPNCHRAIHHGSIEEKRKRLLKLYEESAMRMILVEKGICSDFEIFFKKFYQ